MHRGGFVIRASDLSTRDVINTVDGRRLGNIVDVELDLNTGKIIAVVVPGPSKVLGLLGRTDDYVVELTDHYFRRTTR